MKGNDKEMVQFPSDTNGTRVFKNPFRGGGVFFVTILPIKRVLTVMYPYFEVPKNLPRLHPPPKWRGYKTDRNSKSSRRSQFLAKKRTGTAGNSRREKRNSSCPKKFPAGVYVGCCGDGGDYRIKERRCEERKRKRKLFRQRAGLSCNEALCEGRRWFDPTPTVLS